MDKQEGMWNIQTWVRRTHRQTIVGDAWGLSLGPHAGTAGMRQPCVLHESIVRMHEHTAKSWGNVAVLVGWGI